MSFLGVIKKFKNKMKEKQKNYPLQFLLFPPSLYELVEKTS